MARKDERPLRPRKNRAAGAFWIGLAARAAVRGHVRIVWNCVGEGVPHRRRSVWCGSPDRSARTSSRRRFARASLPLSVG